MTITCRGRGTGWIELSKGSQRGFVLVATLWILAIITIAAAFFAERVGRSVALARQGQETAEQLVMLANTRADILFRLGTLLPSFQGVGIISPIALDNRPYRGEGGDTIRLQDNLGLLNVNFVQPPMMSRFLGQMGVPFEKRDAMIDTLRDYTDLDDLRRLNGAEAADYASLGLPHPPNDWMVTPLQLKNIIGWRDEPALWKARNVLQLVTTSRSSGFNPNTAPAEVLASLPGITPEVAATLVKARLERPVYGHTQLPGFVDGSIDPEYFTFFPGNGVRITQQSRKLPWVLESNVTLTPFGELAPWRVDYQVRTAVSYALENEDKIPGLPPWAPTTDPEAP